jgi:hypothetical protein
VECPIKAMSSNVMTFVVSICNEVYDRLIRIAVTNNFSIARIQHTIFDFSCLSNDVQLSTLDKPIELTPEGR